MEQPQLHNPPYGGAEPNRGAPDEVLCQPKMLPLQVNLQTNPSCSPSRSLSKQIHIAHPPGLPPNKSKLLTLQGCTDDRDLPLATWLAKTSYWKISANWPWPLKNPSAWNFAKGRIQHTSGISLKVSLNIVLHKVGKWHLGFCNETYLPTSRGFQTFFGQYNQACNYYTRYFRKTSPDYAFE